MRIDKLLNSRNKKNDEIHQTPDFLKGVKVTTNGYGRNVTGIRFITPDEPVKPTQHQCD